jgi:hypothetical protein
MINAMSLREVLLFMTFPVPFVALDAVRRTPDATRDLSHAPVSAVDYPALTYTECERCVR